jgi:hypothetical protein
VTPFQLAKVMGTSIRMLERHYGTLIAGARHGIATRLAALESEQEKASTPAGSRSRSPSATTRGLSDLGGPSTPNATLKSLGSTV